MIKFETERAKDRKDKNLRLKTITRQKEMEKVKNFETAENIRIVEK